MTSCDQTKDQIVSPVILGWIWVSAIIASLVGYPYIEYSWRKLLENKQRPDTAHFLFDRTRRLYKKINIFDAFIEGAKGGFETAVRIIPYLVGMLVAISLLRGSGTFDVISRRHLNIYCRHGCRYQIC